MSIASGSSTRHTTPEDLKTREDLTTGQELSAPTTGTPSASAEEPAGVLPPRRAGRGSTALRCCPASCARH